MKGIEDCLDEIIERMEEEGVNSKRSLLYYADKWLIETGQTDDYRREELIRIIEHSVENLTL